MWRAGRFRLGNNQSAQIKSSARSRSTRTGARQRAVLAAL